MKDLTAQQLSATREDLAALDVAVKRQQQGR